MSQEMFSNGLLADMVSRGAFVGFGAFASGIEHSFQSRSSHLILKERGGLYSLTTCSLLGSGFIPSFGYIESSLEFCVHQNGQTGHGCISILFHVDSMVLQLGIPRSDLM